MKISNRNLLQNIVIALVIVAAVSFMVGNAVSTGVIFFCYALILYQSRIELYKIIKGFWAAPLVTRVVRLAFFLSQ